MKDYEDEAFDDIERAQGWRKRQIAEQEQGEPVERLMEKLARLGAEAGIKQMTPELYKFSWLLNEDKNKMWDEWAKKRLEEKRPWVELTDEEIMEMLDYGQYGRVPQYARNFVDAIEAKLKQKNGYAEEKNT